MFSRIRKEEKTLPWSDNGCTSVYPTVEMVITVM